MLLSVRNSTITLMSVLLLVGLSFAPARATETVLRSFDSNYASGAYPVGQLALSGTTFYGVTEYGVSGYGNIFTMTAAGAVKTIHEFGGSDGYVPNAGLVASGGNFYGTTIYGGSSNAGVVFKVTPAGVVSILHPFTGGSDGAYPYAGLLLASDGAFYGVTTQGGSSNQGVVFTIKPDGTGYAIIHNFNYATDNAFDPSTALAETSTGVLYGTANNTIGFTGGIYKLNKDGSNFTFVHGFTGTDTSGFSPSSDLVKGSDGNLYGVCANGGAFNLGTVFKITPGASDTIAPLWSFDGYTGAYPSWSSNNHLPQNRLLVGSDHNLYGVTQRGGAYGYGTAFKLTLAGVCTPFTSFNATDTSGTTNPLVQSGTSYYATSYNGGLTGILGGTDGYGGAVSITSVGALKLIQSFYVQDGYASYGSLVQVGTGAAAAFYGVAASGGEFNDGVIFKITSTGAFSIIHHLNDYVQEGYSPTGGLLLGRDGFLYGTTNSGGTFGYGTIFKVTTKGVLTVLHQFQSIEGYNMSCALVQGIGTDTNLYGAGYSGGTNGVGSVFVIATTGAGFKVLRYFLGPNGANPACQLLPDGLGNLYGTTFQGGANNLGTIFKVSTKGTTFTKLFDFYYDNVSNTYPAGYDPNYAGSFVLNGGFLFGAVQYGGATGGGVIFKCNVTTGATTAFHSFDNSIGEGSYPLGGLLYDSSSGNFFGTTSQGGAGGYGTVYKVKTTTGALTVLHSFTNGKDGANPYSGVILGTDGFLYGTTVNGGTANYGTVYQETP
jgi:uncharacterized repeat protein (TIGR03803 family)